MGGGITYSSEYQHLQHLGEDGKDTESAEDVENVQGRLLQDIRADWVNPISLQERQKAGTTSLEPSLEFCATFRSLRTPLLPGHN